MDRKLRDEREREREMGMRRKARIDFHCAPAASHSVNLIIGAEEQTHIHKDKRQKW